MTTREKDCLKPSLAWEVPAGFDAAFEAFEEPLASFSRSTFDFEPVPLEEEDPFVVVEFILFKSPEPDRTNFLITVVATPANEFLLWSDDGEMERVFSGFVPFVMASFSVGWGTRGWILIFGGEEFRMRLVT